MEATMLSEDSLRIAGILILALATVAFGGMFVLRVTRGNEPATEFQRRFFRAGHAHAGVLLILALVTQPYVDASGMTGVAGGFARSGVAAAALLMSAGFFLSAIGRGVERPNRFIVLLWIGAASLVAGVVSLGLGLLLG